MLVGTSGLSVRVGAGGWKSVRALVLRRLTLASRGARWHSHFGRLVNDAAATFSQSSWRCSHSKTPTLCFQQHYSEPLDLEARLSWEEVDKIAVVCPDNGILLCAKKKIIIKKSRQEVTVYI